MLQFFDATSAIQWAEEQASRPDVGSQIGKILKPAGGGGDPVWDVALSISARLAETDPKVAGISAKAMYGPRSKVREEALGELIGQHLLTKQEAEGKQTEQLIELGTATVRAERTMTLYGERYPAKRMAREVGISRQQFCNGLSWLALRGEAREVLRHWLDQADREMTQWLGEMGWLIGEAASD